MEAKVPPLISETFIIVGVASLHRHSSGVALATRRTVDLMSLLSVTTLTSSLHCHGNSQLHLNHHHLASSTSSELFGYYVAQS